VVGEAERPGALGGGEGGVAVDGGAVGVLDGAEAGGEAGFAAAMANRATLAVAASRMRLTVWLWGSRRAMAITWGVGLRAGLLRRGAQALPYLVAQPGEVLSDRAGFEAEAPKWFEQALAYATEKLHGAAPALAP
jgi:hypothetical protein